MKRSFPILIAIIFIFLSACAPIEKEDTPTLTATPTPTLRPSPTATSTPTPLPSATPEIVLPTATEFQHDPEFTLSIFGELLGCDSLCFQELRFGHTTVSEALEILERLNINKEISVREYNKTNQVIISVKLDEGDIRFTFYLDKLQSFDGYLNEIQPGRDPNTLVEILGDPGVIQIERYPIEIEMHLNFPEHNITLEYWISTYFDPSALKAWICHDSLGRLYFYHYLRSDIARDFDLQEVGYGFLREDILAYLRWEQECFDLD